MTDITSALSKNLLTFDFFKKSIHWTNVQSKKYFKTEYTIERISEDFFKGELKVGDIIVAGGFLSKYGNYRKPETYMNLIGKATYSVQKEFKNHNIKKNEVMRSMKMEILQHPVQVVPTVTFEKKRYCVCFLYNNTISNFHFEIDKDINEKIKNKLSLVEDYDSLISIKPFHKPLIILLNENDAFNYSERKVKLLGKLIPVPTDLSSIFSESLTKTSRELLSNSFRPFSNFSEMGFCIDCREPDTFEITQKSSRFNSLRGTIYIESHFENIDNTETYLAIEKQMSQILGNVFSDKQPVITSYGKPNEKCYLSYTGIDVIQKNNFFGFYVDTDLNDQLKFNESLKKLVGIYQNFKNKSSEIVSEKENKEASLKLDFMFDYSRKDLFDKVLLSKEVSEIMDKKPELISTINWLRA